jgi:glyoxylase-like metal-dependent hydrolase (beta-lactamase superfamily II)
MKHQQPRAEGRARPRPGVGYRIDTASAVVYPVWDGRLQLRLDHCYPDVPATAWRDFADVVDMDEVHVRYELGGYLVVTPRRRVLLDCGMRRTSLGHAGALLSSIRALGVEPEDVTDVAFSHLHADHVGWASVDGAAVFSEAVYHCHEADWTYFCSAESNAYAHLPDDERSRRLKRIRDLVVPVADRVKPWSGKTELDAGVVLRTAPGHTPGSSIAVIGHGADALVVLGDAVHTPAELSRPAWQFALDDKPALASSTRAALADEIANAGCMVTAPHFPGMRPGRLARTANGLRFVAADLPV